MGRRLVVLGAILLAAALVRRPYLDVPLVRDEGELAYIAQRIAAGDVPYRDAYHQKTPLPAYLLAVFDAGLEGFRRFGLLYGLGATAVVFGLTASAAGGAYAPWAAAAFALLQFGQAGILHQASSEHFMLLWLALGLWAWLGGTGRSAALAGLALGAAYQCKQTALAALAFVLADAYLSRRDSKGGNTALGRALIAIAGFGAVQAAAAGYFASQGAFAEYWACTWTNNWAYVASRAESRPFWAPLRDALAAGGWSLGLWGLGALGLARLAQGRSAAKRLWLLAAALAAAAASAGPYAHYFLPLALPLAIGAAVAAKEATEELRSTSAPRRAAALVLLLAAWLPALARQAAYLLRPEAEKARVLARQPPFEAAQSLGAWLGERTRPGEEILVIGSEPQIYFYARRAAATRMIIAYPMTGPYPYSAALREEFLRRLSERAPKVIVVSQLSTSLSEWPAMIHELLRPAAAFVNPRYRRLTPAESEGADLQRWQRSGLLVLLRRDASL